MRRILATFLILFCVCSQGGETNLHRYLYVATPGIRDYMEYGGHGLLVFDIDQGHKFVRRIPTAGLAENGKPSNVKGIAASIPLQHVFITTLKKMMAIDLLTEKLLWEKSYEAGCDRLAISPDGLTIYCPSLESEHWNVIDAKSGEVKAKIVTKSGAHNTIYGQDGKEVYMGGLKSPFLFIADTSTHQVSRTVGPFAGAIRPFTIDGSQSLCFVNVNGLLGFEIGDLHSGKKLHRVEVAGFKIGPTKRHGCPSHGIALTPDGKEIWVTDAFNRRLHVFDATVMPPVQKESIELRDQPGWITFTLDGKLAYPSTGDVIDVKSRKIITTLQDETGAPVQSEKLVEIDYEGKTPAKAGDQFGFGRATRR
jgi:hypothetical protein